MRNFDLVSSSEPVIGNPVMTTMRIVGVLMLVLGLAAFVHGGSTTTRELTSTTPGVSAMSASDIDALMVPQWVSLGVMVLGGAALVLGFRRS